MSRIDALIAQHCPDGVPYVALSEVATYSDTRVNSSELDETSFVGVDNLVANQGGRIDANYRPNTERLTEYKVGDILIGNIRPYLKKVWRATNAGGCSGDVLAVRIRQGNTNELCSKFLYYLLSSDRFFSYDMQHAKGAKMPRGNKDAILAFRIPVPPIEVQQEIVAILDKFTHLEAELEAELNSRRTQYTHYRDRLLTFPDDTEVQWVKIGDITDGISSGRNKIRLSEGEFPVYGSTGQIGFCDEPPYSGNALLVARVGANAGAVAAVGGNYDVSDNTLIARPTDRWNIRFAFHQLTHMNLNQYAVGGGQPLITAGLLKELKIPLPSICGQEHIAAVLDTFDGLVNDLSTGLPAELTARRNQFAYYRNHLLTFKNLSESSMSP